MSTTLDDALVAALAGQVSGSVLRPQDVGYESARALLNGLIDRNAGADCALPDDVRRGLGARMCAPGWP